MDETKDGRLVQMLYQSLLNIAYFILIIVEVLKTVSLLSAVIGNRSVDLGKILIDFKIQLRSSFYMLFFSAGSFVING